VAQISSLIGRRVWDSRGYPTVEAQITTNDGKMARAIAPAGASRGKREAVDLRDGGSHLCGRNVGLAVDAINNEIAPMIVGMDVDDQKGIDDAIIALDASANKSRLGGNSTVAVSLATMNAAAASSQVPVWQYIANKYGYTASIPLPEIQIFGGGAHAGRRVDIQDFMIAVPGASSFDEVMEITSNVYFAAGEILQAKGRLAGVADEGGWWPMFESNEQALETLVRAIELAGEVPGDRVVISLDIAASEFYRNGSYELALEERELSSAEFIELLADWVEKYPIACIEDPLAEDDCDGMQAFTKRFGGQLQIIGDDYLVTNAELVLAAAKQGACNAALVKVNQVGTFSEALAAFDAAMQSGWGSIVSARSGETEDVSIAHISTGLGAGQLKVGSFTRSERMAKWNECLRISEQLGDAKFVGGAPIAETWWGKENMGEVK